ncbi:hypothetical protein FRB97_004661 [Tulasnella sp. 331]|nr:hypothetical protein FRB97_004661 [Tulasnella sp. 331]
MGGYAHGVYSCALDSQAPQYFNANTEQSGSGVACNISGAASNQTHLITITNGPLPGSFLTIGNIVINYTDPGAANATTYSSSYPMYQLPPNLTAGNTTMTINAIPSASTPSIPTPTATVRPQGGIAATSSGVSASGYRAAVAFSVLLGLLALLALAAAFFFWRRWAIVRNQSTQVMTRYSAPTPYTILSGEDNSTAVALAATAAAPVPYDPWEPPTQDVRNTLPLLASPTRGPVRQEQIKFFAF